MTHNFVTAVLSYVIKSWLTCHPVRDINLNKGYTDETRDVWHGGTNSANFRISFDRIKYCSQIQGELWNHILSYSKSSREDEIFVLRYSNIHWIHIYILSSYVEAFCRFFCFLEISAFQHASQFVIKSMLQLENIVSRQIKSNRLQI